MKLKNLLLLLLFFPILALNAQWKNLGSGIDASPRQIFTMHAVNDRVIWATTGFDHVNFVPAFEFTRTTDGGQTWQPGLLDIDADLYHFDLLALDSLTAWLTTADEKDPISGKIYKTTDGGINWVYQSTAFTGFNQTPAGIYFWNADEGVAFGATCYENYNDQLAIYTTEDGGDNWEEVTGDQMPDQLAGEGICWWSGNSNYAAVGDTIWFFTSKNRIFRSTDRGRSWEAFLSDLTNAISIAFKDAQNGILVGIYPNGAARTTDGGESWSSIPIPNDIRATEITYVPGTEGTYLIQDGDVMGDQDMLVSHDDGNTWEVVPSNVNLSCFEFLSPEMGYAGGEIQGPATGGIFRWEGDLFSTTTDVRFPEESASKLSIQLYPFPAREEISISFQGDFGDLLPIEIYDLYGRLVRRAVVNDRQSLNIAELAAGMYLMKVKIGSETASLKLLKE